MTWGDSFSSSGKGLIWLLVINTYRGSSTCWGNIIFTKAGKDAQLTFSIIKSISFYLYSVIPVQKGQGVWTENMLASTDPGNSFPTFVSFYWPQAPVLKTHIKSIMALCKHLSVSYFMVSHEWSYFDHYKELQVRIQNLFQWHVMIVCTKSISLKQEADDVINQILHTLFHSSFPSSQAGLSLSSVHGLPVEGSTWISQTI